MKRKLKWLAIVLAVSLLGFGTALLLWPRDRITAESWHKIRIGMTEEEVAEILGGPGMTDKEADAEYGRVRKELGLRPFEFEALLEEPVVPLPLEEFAPTKVVHRGPVQGLVNLDRLKSW